LDKRRKSTTSEITRIRRIEAALDMLLVACVTALVALVVGSAK